MPRSPLIRQGEGQTAAIQRIHQERLEERTRLLAIQNMILNEDTPTPNKNHVGYRSGEGDRQRLRAIPVIAPSISGTIPGTNPLAEIIQREQRQDR